MADALNVLPPLENETFSAATSGRVALIVYDVWKHLHAKQRDKVLAQGVKHGSRAGRYIFNEGSRQIRKRLG